MDHIDEQTKTIKQTAAKKNTSTRDHLKGKFEHTDLDAYLDRDPLDKSYKKYINGKMGCRVFAKRNNSKNEFIAVYRGQTITEEEFDKKCEENDIEYVFFLKKSWRTYIDGKNSMGIGKLINDCSDDRRPNIVPRKHTDKRRIVTLSSLP